MRRKFVIWSLFFATAAVAASVAPVLVDPWQSGDAAFECSQTDCDADFSYKIDAWGDADMDGAYVTDEGNTITISNSDDATFDWSSEWPVCAVIVKGSNSANVYYYDGATGDTGLVAPLNGNSPDPDDTFDISHVSFCYSESDTCYEEDTAWAAGSRYVKRGNWATYTAYPGDGGSVDIYAGKTLFAGTATFTDNGDGTVTIDIDLENGFIFYYDLGSQLADENVKVQDYDSAPSGNPSPGLFEWKATVAVGSTSATITVPLNDFYGIHLDVAHPVPCE